MTEETLVAKNFAVIIDGIVVNAIVAPSKEVAEELTNTLCVEYDEDNFASPGYKYDGASFIAPVYPTK